MKDFFSKEAIGSAVVLGLVIATVLIVRDNLPRKNFSFKA